MELISGIEFSTEYLGRDVHIVGLDFDFKDQEFQTELFRFQDSRNIRNRKMIKRMQEEGIDITWEAMEERFGAAVWTRAHFARYLTDQGYVPEMKDAFSLYLADDAPCFVPREKVTPVQAVRLIHRFNGIPVLAHPHAVSPLRGRAADSYHRTQAGRADRHRSPLLHLYTGGGRLGPPPGSRKRTAHIRRFRLSRQQQAGH